MASRYPTRSTAHAILAARCCDRATIPGTSLQLRPSTPVHLLLDDVGVASAVELARVSPSLHLTWAGDAAVAAYGERVGSDDALFGSFDGAGALRWTRLLRRGHAWFHGHAGLPDGGFAVSALLQGPADWVGVPTSAVAGNYVVARHDADGEPICVVEGHPDRTDLGRYVSWSAGAVTALDDGTIATVNTWDFGAVTFAPGEDGELRIDPGTELALSVLAWTAP